MKVVVLQDRLRLFREGLARLLNSTGEYSVVAVEQLESVRHACGEFHAKLALVELIEDHDRIDRAISFLTQSGVSVVGVRSARQRNSRFGVPMVERTSTPEEFFAMLRGDGVMQIPPQARGRAPGSGALTNRELQVLALIGAGCTSSEISRRLGISTKTVENRRQNIFTKLGVQSQSHAVSIALRAGMLGGAVEMPATP